MHVWCGLHIYVRVWEWNVCARYRWIDPCLVKSCLSSSSKPWPSMSANSRRVPESMIFSSSDSSMSDIWTEVSTRTKWCLAARLPLDETHTWFSGCRSVWFQSGAFRLWEKAQSYWHWVIWLVNHCRNGVRTWERSWNSASVMLVMEVRRLCVEALREQHPSEWRRPAGSALGF